MRSAALARPAATADELARLRERIERIERTSRIGSEAPVLPAPAGIAGLLPGGGLRTGTAYSLDRSMPLITALLAAPSAAGAWCAVIGMPELGIEAAEASGIALDRLVLVPRPGERWLGVAAALAEVVGVVALRPGGTVRDGEAARLAARLRERETVLLVQGRWPGAEASIRAGAPDWTGLGEGHGCLDRGEATIAVDVRRGPGSRRARVVLVGSSGLPAVPGDAVGRGDAGTGHEATGRRLRAVG